MYLASQEGHTAVVELLLKYNADTSLKTNDGTTALLIGIFQFYSLTYFGIINFILL